MTLVQLTKLAARVKGIPDKEDYGNVGKALSPGELVGWFIQKHKARRAGEHFDYRLGTPESKLFSWASKKEMPEPGGPGKAWFQQPLHEYGYGSWQGNITGGYGAGTVRKEDVGKVLLTKVGPGKIHFTIAHKRFPERYALTRDRKNIKKWYLINTTPRVPVEFKKQHYIKIDMDDAKKKMDQPGMSMSPKIDGAAAFLKLLKDKVEIVSYRSNKAGMPIVHTERMFGGLPRVDLPKEMQNQTLRGELYGTRDLDNDGVDEVIPARELGGLLNSSVANSLETQKKNKIKLRMVLFNVMGSKLPHSQKIKFLKGVVKKLPGDQVSVAQQITDPDKMRETFKQIESGKHPMTDEGVVLTPEQGTPYKAKFVDPYRVWINSINPGDKRLKGFGAGGFSYSLSPKGPVVGKVGTGFSDDMRRDMLEHPEEWVGRMAEIEAEEQFPSGAYRGAAFKQLHEDYATK